jgi:hypothetical protein
MTLTIKRYFRLDRSNFAFSKLESFFLSEDSLVNLKKELKKCSSSLSEGEQRLYFKEVCKILKDNPAIVTEKGVFQIKKDDKDDFYLYPLKGIKKFYVRIRSRSIGDKTKEECYFPSYHSDIKITGFKRG